MDVRNHIQSFYKSAGDFGCYAFTLIKAAKKWLYKNNRELEADKICFEQALVDAINNNWVIFNEDYYASRTNFYVRNPPAILSYLTGCNWTVTIENRDYVAKADEIEIDFYATSEMNGKNGTGHFVLTGDTDVLQNSNTVKQGFIYSKRIFRRK